MKANEVIQQLGYSKAQHLLKMISNEPDVVFDIDTKKNIRFKSATGFTYNELKDALEKLDPYAVGDQVMYLKGDSSVYVVREVYDNFVVASDGKDRLFWTMFFDEIRHANPLEKHFFNNHTIQQAHTLGLPESVILSLKQMS